MRRNAAMNPFDLRLTIVAAEARVKTPHVFHCWHAMREMGRQFHPEAYAQFAGLEPRHVIAIMEALAAHDIAAAKREPSARGTRLPNGWKLPGEWAAWAIEQRCWTTDETEAEAELFANYWQAKSGAGAVKLAWEKTWRNWVRQSHRPNGANTGRTLTPEERVDNLRRTIALYDKLGRNDEADQMRVQLDRMTGNVVSIKRLSR